jgi:D-3-phosphoglycerate dehydrogenase
MSDDYKVTQDSRILIIDEVHPLLMEELKEHGYLFDYLPLITRPEILKIIGNYSGLVVRSKTRIDMELLENAKNLKFIARAGSGMDNIDESLAREKGIACINTPEANSNAVGEHTIGMMLSLLRNIAKADNEVRDHVWDREGNRGRELGEMTVGIIGYGNTGMALARKLSGFGSRVIAYDKYKHGFSDSYCTEADMEHIFSDSDILSLHVPLSNETRHLVNAAYIKQFNKNFYLFNLSRGEVVNTEDIVNALESGKILGCGLDVLENEKLSRLNEKEKKCFDYLINSTKTILTPHIGGWTVQSYKKISFYLLKKISELSIIC